MSTMTPKEFVNQVVDAYRKSRVSLHEHSKVRRGESRSIASETEDLLAYYLVTRMPEIDEILINQPLRTLGQSIKPDLVICRHSQIYAFVDVKMDLGYKRDSFDDTLRQKDVGMAQMRNAVFTYKPKSEGKRAQITLPLAQNAKYLFVIVSSQNVSPSRFSVFEKSAPSLSNIEFYVLTRGYHPNDPDPMERITICDGEFQKLERDIRQLIS